MNQNMTQQQSNQPVIATYLKQYKDQIAAALPRHLTPDRMSRIVMTEVRKTPALLSCDPKSLFGAVIQASQLGLEPGSALGHAYLIPFKKDCNLIIGYRGMIDLARRSGQIVSLQARVVHSNDEFNYEFGLHEDLTHVPCETSDCGHLTHVYAVAKLKDGGVQWEVMTKAQVDDVRKQARAGNSGPWATHYEEMAKKTVIRRLFKYLPVSIELQTAVGLDEQNEAGLSQGNADVIEGDFTTMDDMEQNDEIEKKLTAKPRTKKVSAKQSKKPTFEQLKGNIEHAQTMKDINEVLNMLHADLTDQQMQELDAMASLRIDEMTVA